MPPFPPKPMTLLDTILLVGSAAIGLGSFELFHRNLFMGWIWITDLGVPDIQSWSTRDVIGTVSAITSILLPVVGPWTLLLVVLRMRAPRPSWRRIWRQPGMAACLAALLGFCWTIPVLLVATNLARVARPMQTKTADLWAQKYLANEVFMYVGLAVAAVWGVQIFSDRWRRSVDWIDFTGRIVGACWILIGLVWTLLEYLDFV